MAEATEQETAGATPLTGLTSAEVEERVRKGQTNAVRLASSRSYTQIVLDNAANFVNLVLFGISILLVIIGLTGDAVLTAGLVLGNVVVGIFQESRAKRQLDQIALLTKPSATVIRDGEERSISPEQIVLDDLVIVRAGDQVLADGTIVAEEGMSVDESLLTGESDLVWKDAGDKLSSGSFAMTGSATMKVEQVGAGSMAQKITEQARSFRNVRTPLQTEVGLVISTTAMIVAFMGFEVVDSFHDLYGKVPLVEGARAAAVIVALVPQGLWFMITVTYAMAIVRLARIGALIQRMNAVESISHVDVLCFDKTGTLTTNSLALEAAVPSGIEEAELKRLLGHFAASASFSNRTNEAVLAAYPQDKRKTTTEVVFDSARKWSALVFDDADIKGLYVLGAPEMLTPMLAAGAQELDLQQYTSQGLRVLLFAHTDAPPALDSEKPVLPDGLTLLGAIVLRDQLRAEAADTIARFREAGIGLKMISGDHPETVTALAQQAGFGDDVTSISGLELDALEASKWPTMAQATSIFGRVSPQHKEKLIQTLQASGHYVAMIGDGVNDVPALKAAQVSVSLRSASPVTRSVADIVLLRDSFAVLPAAFLEGQRIRNGMIGIMKLFLVRILSVSIVILGASFLDQPFPVTPRHTALIAVLTVGFPALALAAFAKPGRTQSRLLPQVSSFVMPASLALGIVGLVVYWLFMSESGDIDRSRSILTSICCLCGVLLIPYSIHKPATWLNTRVLLSEPRELALTVVMLIAFVAAWLTPTLRNFYELKTLGVLDWLAVVLAVAAWAGIMKGVWTLIGRARSNR